MDAPRTSQVGLRLPKDILDRLDARARKETRTRTNLVVHLLRLALERGGGPEEPARVQ